MQFTYKKLMFPRIMRFCFDRLWLFLDCECLWMCGKTSNFVYDKICNVYVTIAQIVLVVNLNWYVLSLLQAVAQFNLPYFVSNMQFVDGKIIDTSSWEILTIIVLQQLNNGFLIVCDLTSLRRRVQETKCVTQTLVILLLK